jgi:hypothetical protein
MIEFPILTSTFAARSFPIHKPKAAKELAMAV